MNQTENYQLPQWEAGDTIKREDFNDLAARTDAALGDLQTAVAGAASFVAGAYSGNGSYPREFTLGFKPRAVVIARRDGIMGNGSSTLGGVFGTMGALTTAGGSTLATVSDTGFTLRGEYVNTQGYAYYYVAIK